MSLVTGRTVDEEENPVPDVLISLTNDERYSTNSNSEGEFSIDVPDGEYMIKAIHSNYDTGRRNIVLPEDSNLDIILMRE